MKINVLHFFDLYVEAAGENIIEVKRELEEAGIDYDKSLERTMELFRQAEAELKLEKGEKKREKWIEMQERIFEPAVRNFTGVLAYRKREGLSEDDIKEQELDKGLLKELSEGADDK